MKNASTVDDDDDVSESGYRKPESFFVFMVGIDTSDDGWDPDRDGKGDIGFMNEFLESGVPPDQITFVKDEDATKKNCENVLENLLRNSRPSSTLVFYYAGHGLTSGFDTHEEEWKHKDIVCLIESFFCGERVVLLADTCSSGSFYRPLQPRNSVKKNYFCALSTAPYTEAGGPWTFTTCWIECLRCNHGSLKLSRVLEFLSDLIARDKGDLFTAYLGNGVKLESCVWLPQRGSRFAKKKLEWPRLQYHIPSDARVTRNVAIGDRVYYKHSGGPFEPGATDVPPLWLPSTIEESYRNGEVLISVLEPIAELQWKVKVSRSRLLNDWHMAQLGMVPESFFDAECALAKSIKFLDYSILTGSSVDVIGDDGIVYDARVMDCRDFDWDAFLNSGQCNDDPPYGPYVPIVWSVSNQTCLVPKGRIVNPPCHEVPSFHTKSSFKLGGKGSGPRSALIKSIETNNKKVTDARDFFGKSAKLLCYWPGDGEWYHANALSPSSVPLEVLASHSLFTISGTYCPVHYSDDTSYMVPLHYIRVRKRTLCPSLSCFFRNRNDEGSNDGDD